MLSNAQILEFKDIYFREYGIKLLPEEAVRKATGLFNLFKSFSRLNSKKLLDNLDTR